MYIPPDRRVCGWLAVWVMGVEEVSLCKKSTYHERPFRRPSIQFVTVPVG